MSSNSPLSGNNISADGNTSFSSTLPSTIDTMNKAQSHPSSPLVTGPHNQNMASVNSTANHAIYPKPAVFPASSMVQNHSQTGNYRMYWPQSTPSTIPPVWGAVPNVPMSSQAHFQNANAYPQQQAQQLYLHSIHHSYPHLPRVSKSHSLGANAPMMMPRAASPQHLSPHSMQPATNSHQMLPNLGSSDTNSMLSHPQPSRIHHRSSFPSSNTPASIMTQPNNNPAPSLAPSPLPATMPHLSCPASPISSKPSSVLPQNTHYDRNTTENQHNDNSSPTPNQTKPLSTPPHDLAGSLPFIHKPLHPKIQPAIPSQRMNPVPYQPNIHSRRPITFINGAPDSTGRRRKRSRLNYFDRYSASIPGSSLPGMLNDGQVPSMPQNGSMHSDDSKSTPLTFKQYQMKGSNGTQDSSRIVQKDESNIHNSFALQSLSSSMNTRESINSMYTDHLEDTDHVRYDDNGSSHGKRGRKRGSRNSYMSRLSKFVRVPQTKLPVSGPQRRMSVANTGLQNEAQNDDIVSTYDVRRASSTSDSGIIATDNGLFQCADCGKTYKHQSCLLKHRWEHSEFWNDARKYSLTKHQQVQIMEAAQILLELEAASIEELEHYQDDYSPVDDITSDDSRENVNYVSDNTKIPLTATSSA